MNNKKDINDSKKAGGLQARKSKTTRSTLIDTTVRCLVKYGYHDTTYIKIAEESGFSRGAMRHHFPARIDIIRATIEHLHQRRLAAFSKVAAGIPDNPSRTRANIEALWQHVNHPVFMIFIELALAARRDRDLDAVLRAAQENFRKECYYTALELFPEWLEHREQLSLAIDLSLYMMEGMVLDNLAADGAQAGELLDYLERELNVLKNTTVKPKRRRQK